jgi:hypothetical protein
MEITHSFQPIHGIPKGLIVGQHARTDEINSRVSMRQFSDRPLAPNFNPRPVPTKYALFPIHDRRTTPLETIHAVPSHNVATNFSPATQNGPVETYLANIHTETLLRNQTVSLQKGAPQGVYMPSSSSDLYQTAVYGRTEEQTHPSLFSREKYQTQTSQVISESGIGKNTFFNHTRTQLRNLS